MDLKFTCSVVVGALAGLALMSATPHVRAQDANKAYPRMLPLADYLMERNAEIALARSAAPEAIARDATVLVLGPQGWKTAVHGNNGFVCMVERAWASSISFSEVWNPKMRGPDCLNAAAARSLLPIVDKLTQMTLAGTYSESARIAGIQKASAKGEFAPLAPGAMGYMMSKQAYLTDQGSHNLSHVMFFLPTRNHSGFGAGVPQSPVSSISYWFPDPGKDNPMDRALPPVRFLVVAVPNWSDGTSAVGN